MAADCIGIDRYACHSLVYHAETAQLQPVNVFVVLVYAFDLGCNFELVVTSPQVAALMCLGLRFGLCLTLGLGTTFWRAEPLDKTRLAHCCIESSSFLRVIQDISTDDGQIISLRLPSACSKEALSTWLDQDVVSCKGAFSSTSRE